jgi:hypothetical protein
MAVLQCQLLGVEGDPDDPAQGQRRDHAAGGGVDRVIERALDDEAAPVGLEGQDQLVALRDDRDAVGAEADLLDANEEPRLEGGVHRVSLRQWSW